MDDISDYPDGLTYEAERITQKPLLSSIWEKYWSNLDYPARRKKLLEDPSYN